MYKMHQPEKVSDVPRPPGSDVEGEDGARPESNFKGVSDVQKWKEEDWMKKGVLALGLRACALLFSFLSFILMVVIPNFHLDQGYSFVFALALICMVYTAIQVGIKGDELRTGRYIISPEIAVWIDFVGDQVVAYMLLASASAGAMSIQIEKLFGFADPTIDKAAAAAAMSFLAFFALAPASLISGYHLFTELSRS